MALVTVQRSPSTTSPESLDSLGLNGEEIGRNCKSLSECYFAGKGTALVLPEASESSSTQKFNRQAGGTGNGIGSGGGTGGGTAGSGCNIQKHLQSMFYLLRPEETLKMAVKLESVHPVRTRYLVVVSRMGHKAEESCLLGIDCNERTTVGLVLRVLADTTITLDGDGGFSVAVCGRHHIFKPVSVQAMWSALQTLHKVSSKARDANYYQQSTPNPPGLISSTAITSAQVVVQTATTNNITNTSVSGTIPASIGSTITHSWVSYYESRIESDRSCLNEWHAMDNLESRRPPSPDSVRTKPKQREDTERVIRTTLKEIMMSVDLDEVTSKYIRSRLEEDLDMDLGEYKSFIDEEMLVILGQMDAPTEIFEHVFLGSEWNASNYEELQRNGVGHILNVTREIDNFFPGTFDYLNIRVYDDEKTDLLKYWDDTFKYISRAKDAGSKVLVHCKMGVSRSASVVIAYAMKAYNWNFTDAMDHVKRKRNCIKPNSSFLSQLETYQGILDAMKNKEKLQRSKSESNLKSPGLVAKNERALVGGSNNEPTHLPHEIDNAPSLTHIVTSGGDLRSFGERPKSWSPENNLSNTLLTDYNTQPPVFLSLENIHDNNNSNTTTTQHNIKEQSDSDNDNVLLLFRQKLKDTSSARNVLLPCDNGESYSVSPNQIVHLPGQIVIASVRDRVSEFEGHCVVASGDRKRQLCLNLTPVFEHRVVGGEGGVQVTVSSKNEQTSAVDVVPDVVPDSVTILNTAWDPGERNVRLISSVTAMLDNAEKCDSEIDNVPVTMVQQQKGGDMFSNCLDHVFDREEKKLRKSTTIPNVAPIITSTNSDEDIHRESPSRQSSWSSIDSAVVLGYQGEKREGPSRNSSWGSVDARTLPSRNSSWGSYDNRCLDPATKSNEALLTADSTLEDLSRCHFGTVKKTRQKLLLDDPITVVCEAVNSALLDNNTSAIDIVKQRAKQKTGHIARLSVSAPEPSTMELVPAELPSLSRSASKLDNVEQTAGIVRNLKREFEAKTKADQNVAAMNMNNCNSEPIIAPEDKFKSLIDKFEVQPEENRVIQRAKTDKSYRNNSSRYSCIELSVEKSPIRITQTSYNSKRDKPVPDSDYKRPPKSPAVRNNAAPNIVVSAFPFLAKDTKKQQQYGKTHPLARLHFKPRSNPVYNTM